MTQQTLAVVRLSVEQAKLLVKIHTSPTAKAAFGETRDGRQAVEAANLLNDLGLIQLTSDEAIITPTGSETLRDESLVDDVGELTAHAKELVGDNEPGGTNMPPPEQSDAFPSDNELSGTDAESLPRMESFTLIKQLNARL